MPKLSSSAEKSWPTRGGVAVREKEVGKVSRVLTRKGNRSSASLISGRSTFVSRCEDKARSGKVQWPSGGNDPGQAATLQGAVGRGTLSPVVELGSRSLDREETRKQGFGTVWRAKVT